MTIKEIAVVDIETTALYPEEGTIIEVGICKLNLIDGSITKLIDSLIYEGDFDKDRDAHAWIFQNSSLSVEEVIYAPDWELIRLKIREIFDRFPVVSYNTQFDIGWLKSRGIYPIKELPDPMLLATPVLKLPPQNPEFGDYKWPSVQECWDHYFPNIPYKEDHRAYDDCVHEAQIIYAMFLRGHYKII